MTPGEKKETPPQEIRTTSFWSPFRGRVFRLLWAATVVANIGGWMYNAAAGWLMTSLDSDPLMVSLVQAAASLPMFLFALPAGALADIIDKRRFILTLEVLVTLVSVVFAAWSLPISSLQGRCCCSCSSAARSPPLEAPAWQSIVPQLVPKEDLSAAVAANSVGVNISRAVGPALAGVIIAGFGIAAPFWLDAFSNVGVIAVFLWWRTSHGHLRTLPAERFKSAIRTGIRYSLNNRRLRATLLRAVGFFLFASAYWALLPLVARNQIAGGPELVRRPAGRNRVWRGGLRIHVAASEGKNRHQRAGDIGRSWHRNHAGSAWTCPRTNHGRLRKPDRGDVMDCGCRKS